jgi:hypothetical protein
MPIAYAPPWIHTITGNPAPGPGSGDQTLIVSQLSPAASRANVSMPNAAACGGGGPYDTASCTPPHPRTGRGAAKRSAPTGGSANGMPRKTATPASQLPRSVPPDARTSGRDPDRADGATVITAFPSVQGEAKGLAANRTRRIIPSASGCAPTIYDGPDSWHRRCILDALNAPAGHRRAGRPCS